MAEKSAVVFLSLFYNFLYICASKEAEVFCAEGADCVLPCSFKVNTYTSIHWKKTPGDERVHSYYDSVHRLEHQHLDFINRTSLFSEDITKGNGSLLLSEVTLEDSGRYECLTGSGDGSISTVNVKVYERSFEVDVVRHGSELVCSAEKVFPEPTVTWFTGDPPTETEGNTTVYHREDHRYDVNSSATLPFTFTVSTCNVSTAHYWRSTEIIEEYLLGVLYNDAVLRCPVSKAPPVSVIWKFNHTEIVFVMGAVQVFNESWRPLVDAVTESNSLVLKDLTQDQEGLYSCHVSTDHHTFVSVINLEIQLIRRHLESYEDAAAELVCILVWVISAFVVFVISFFFKEN